MIQWQRQPQVSPACGGLHLGLNSKRPVGTNNELIPIPVASRKDSRRSFQCDVEKGFTTQLFWIPNSLHPSISPSLFLSTPHSLCPFGRVGERFYIYKDKSELCHPSASISFPHVETTWATRRAREAADGMLRPRLLLIEQVTTISIAPRRGLND